MKAKEVRELVIATLGVHEPNSIRDLCRIINGRDSHYCGSIEERRGYPRTWVSMRWCKAADCQVKYPRVWGAVDFLKRHGIVEVKKGRYPDKDLSRGWDIMSKVTLKKV